jgi:hypothetical protein
MARAPRVLAWRGKGELSGGPRQVPGVCGQLSQVHVHQGGSRVLLAPRHCVPQRQAGIVAPCLCRLFRSAAQLTGRVGQLHVRGLVSGRGVPARGRERPPGGPLRQGGRSVRAEPNEQPPRTPAPGPQQPRPKLRIDNRHDLTYRWHLRLRAHWRPVRSGSELEPGGPFPFHRAHHVAGNRGLARPTGHTHPT